MKALVVYESFWGNTAAIGKAIAEGLGDSAVAVPTDEATPEMLGGVDLLVVGAPLLGFTLPTEAMRKNLSQETAKGAPAPDLGHPLLRSWIAGLPVGLSGRSATFETRIWWSPGSAAKTLSTLLNAAGYPALTAPEKFIVSGKYGPLKEGELERARAWGATLGEAAAGRASAV